jgi:hypothetical protein
MTREKEEHEAKGLPASVKADKYYRDVMLGAGNPNQNLDSYLQNDGLVLRFYALWDDKTRYGSVAHYIIHFFLADNTVEVLESYCRNSGRDPFPCFSKRGPMPKKVVSAGTVPGMSDNTKNDVTYNDLVVGEHCLFLGREFFIYDCDSATRTWYKQNCGIEQGKVDVSDPVKVKPTLKPPPHQGIGTREDSLQSVLALRPKAYKQDLGKLMTNAGIILRFEGVMDNPKAEDVNRRFIVMFYKANDTTQVYEVKTRNSGQWEGKMCDRAKRVNVMSKSPENPEGDYFKCEDFFVGALVKINGVVFHLQRADEYTLKHMETHCGQFPLSDITQICQRYSAALDTLQNEICVKQGKQTVTPDEIRACGEACGVDMIDHELITVIRALITEGAASGDSDELPANAFIELVQTVGGQKMAGQ